MSHGKIKALYGLYKLLGRESFLDKARRYTNHIKNTIEDTISEMESRWYDAAHTKSEADMMVDDYNDGKLGIDQDKSLVELENVDIDIDMKM